MHEYIELFIEPAASTTLLQALEQRFTRLAQAQNLPEITQQLYWEDLHQHYEQPQRAYHNFVHLHNLFTLLDQYPDSIEDRLVVELAIWYHDVIYEVSRADNEEQSAHYFTQRWEPYCSTSTLHHTQALILATAGHQPRTRSADEAFFLDADLAILAALPECYQQYSHAIAEEYSILYTPDMYRVGRHHVLETFLERPQLFFTDLFKVRYEAGARYNLTQELASLEQ